MTNKADIIWLDKVDSTNNEARRRMEECDNLSVISAVVQTDGRGQKGNLWHAAPGENLTFSIVMKFSPRHAMQFQAYDQFAIGQMNALAILDFLSLHRIEAKIKWPNDIYVGDRKIAGTLIENSLKGEWLSWSIVGTGINANQTTFPTELVNPTSMALETGRKFDNKELLEQFVEIFEQYRNRYLHINGGLGKLKFLYESQMWRHDQESGFIDLTSCPGGHFDGPINIEMPSSLKSFRGVATGVSDTGNLLVRVSDTGEIREFAFKEVAWIL